jgi:hypothetical protein
LLRYYGTVRTLSSGEGSGKASFHAGSPSDLDLPERTATHTTRTTSSSWFESERVFFGRALVGLMRVRARVERKERTGHASQQRHHHEPMRWDCGRGCCRYCLYLWDGCSFLSHAPPVFMPTDRVTAALSSTYISSQCCVGYVFFFLLTAPPSPCWRCTTHCCGVAKSTTHGFITDGRLGWRHARAARSLARSEICGSQCCHYLIPRGHQPN